MKSFWTLLVPIFTLLPGRLLTAQETRDISRIKYSPEYVFKDGIYFNIDAVKANDPIPFSRIVTNRYEYNRDFFNELIINEEIVLYDEAGVRASIRTNEVWGYVLHGRIHLMVGGRFQRFMLLGSISYFMASETTNEKVFYSDEDTSRRYTTTQDLYRGFYRDRYYYRNLTAEGEVCLFDFETNTLSPYNPSALGKLLERDSLLFSDYSSLRKREQRKRMAEFIRKYNRDHPLYFPSE